MRRLFMLRKGRNGTPIYNLYFCNKENAKSARDSGRHGNGLVVSYGPDHRKYTD